MARDGSGNYSLPAGNPTSTGSVISTTWANATLPDIATALTNSIAKDGQTTPTANLPMGGNRHTGVADGTVGNQYASINQAQNGSLIKVGSVANVVDAFTGSVTPAIAGYTDGLIVTMTPSVTSTTTTPTLALNGLPVKPIQKMPGVACVVGDIVLNVPVHLQYTTQGGGYFMLLNPATTGAANPTGTVGLATVNGTLGTYLRSDSAPPLSQAITPVWSGAHKFTLVAFDTTRTYFSPGDGRWVIGNSGGATDAKFWDCTTNATDIFYRTVNDATNNASNYMQVTRSGFALTAIKYGSTDNPTYTFLGTGTASFGGAVSVGTAVKIGTTVGLATGANLYSTGTDDLCVGTVGTGVARFFGGAVEQLRVGSTAQVKDEGGTLQTIGFRDIPQQVSTASSRVTIAADRGQHIYITGGGTTQTIAANASVAYPVGATITFVVATGVGSTTAIAINSDTLVFAANNTTGTRTLAAGGLATALKVTSNTWHISGAGLS